MLKAKNLQIQVLTDVLVNESFKEELKDKSSKLKNESITLNNFESFKSFKKLFINALKNHISPIYINDA